MVCNKLFDFAEQHTHILRHMRDDIPGLPVHKRFRDLLEMEVPDKQGVNDTKFEIGQFLA